MTPVLVEDENNAMKIKQNLISNVREKEEMRTLLNFSRENLNISHSDLEQGFNRSPLRLNRIMILCVVVLIISVLCLGVTSWYLSCLLSNTREIEQLKRNFENLKHQLLQRDLMDELKAFEEQLYTEESSEDNDPNEADIDNADYDSNYDDDGSATHDYSGDYHTSFTYSSSSELTEMSTPMPMHFNSNKTIGKLLAALHKVEVKRGDEFEKNIRGNHKNDEREHFKKEHKMQSSHEISGTNSKKYKRDVAKDTASVNNIKKNIKLKRSVSDHTVDDLTTNTSNNQNDGRYHSRISGTGVVDTSEDHIYVTRVNNKNNDSRRNSTPHPPKKYYAHARPQTVSSVHDDQLSEEINRPDGHGMSKSTESLSEISERVNWRNARHDITGNRTGIRRPIHIYAIHYGADSTRFLTEDEHIGNGRARHNNGIFKAWQPSNWVADLGMDRHFTLATDGKLIVHEPGLYLVYAQIHYLDHHDENGFHILMNGSPILQCMVYSPGLGHKSRSCFSAQAIVLHAGDYLVVKDIASSRYTLFQQDKSFFGLVKLGELRNQQRH